MNSSVSLGDHREIALQLLEQLEVLLKKKDDESSKTAKIVCDSIACHLKDGGANLSRCESCGFYKWGRQRKNDRWKDVIHDPHGCPKMKNTMNDDMFLMRETFGVSKTTAQSRSVESKIVAGNISTPNAGCKRNMLASGHVSFSASFPDMSILRREKVLDSAQNCVKNPAQNKDITKH